MSIERSDDASLAIWNTSVNTLSKAWHGLRTLQTTWNVKSARQNMDKIRPILNDFAVQWEEADKQLTGQLGEIVSLLKSEVYASNLESEMRGAGIQFSGEFPQYVFPPFKLSISPESLEARLSLGRKSERTADLHPAQLAQWVGTRYKKVLSRRFNAPAFMKDLLAAYRIANKLHFHHHEPTYGRAVPLTEIYDILTIRQTSRQDYPLQFFVFDLGLMKESAVLKFEKFKFEFGSARDQKRALVVVDSSGRESFISSLTVYAEEES